MFINSPEAIAARHARVARRFTVGCRIAALVWLVGVVTINFLRRPTFQDFPQYYMAGVIAVEGAWEALYPVPNPGSTNNPGWIADSTMRPRYAQLAAERSVGDTYRFIQPPPNALLYAPLGLMPYRPAQWVWIGAMTLCTFGVAYQAGRLFETCVGRPTGFAGLVTLFVACSPLAYWTIRVGNVSPLVGLCVGGVALGLIRRRDALAGAGGVIGTLTKYAPAVLVPLVIAMRRWRTLAWAVVFTIVVIVVSLAVMGTGPFAVFFDEVWPTLSRSSPGKGNQSIEGFLLRATDAAQLAPPLRWVLRIARVASIAGVLYIVLRRPLSYWNDPVNVSAGAAALLLWLLTFSPIFWEHYAIYAAPLWGWLLWEAWRRWRWFVILMPLVLLHWLPLPVLSIHPLPEPIGSSMLFSSLLLLWFAVSRVWLGSVAPARWG